MTRPTERIRASATTRFDQSGLRLDQAAAALFPEHSRARLQKWIRKGWLTVDGRVMKTTFRISGGETLEIDAEAERQAAVIPQDIPIDIIHADDDIIVLDKPAGLVVHPAAGNPDGTLQNALLSFDPTLAALPRAGIVHRLDKDTSGIMVVARSLRAHTSLVEQLQTRSVSRVYRAVAKGEIRSGGSVDAPIGRHPKDRKRMAVVARGRSAVSHFRVLENFGYACHLEISLETGRTHQIRVHMAHIGHALVGDPVYGRRLKLERGAGGPPPELIRTFPRQALHAHALALLHPDTGDKVSFQAPLPEDFRALLAALRGAAS